MGNGGEGMFFQRQPILEADNYGYWKAKMKQIIRGINEDAWTSVEVGWTAPTETNEDTGVVTVKKKEDWSEDEKKLSKYNSRALSTIFGAVDKDQFKLIQNCETAKDAWEVLQRSYEGTPCVKRTRLDSLASQFENLRMGENETITDFSSRISSIANEADLLGKKYKDKKLVKKLLRCLPAKFTAYKTSMSVSSNTDEMKFCDDVGMLKSHEMETQVDEKTKGSALTGNDENKKLEDLGNTIGLLARRFERAVLKGEVAQKKFFSGRKSFEPERGTRRIDARCHECKGFGHWKNDCPNLKRRESKCLGCKGIGHTQADCVIDLKKVKGRSMMGIDDSESEDEDSEEEELKNFVAFLGITDFVEEQTGTKAVTGKFKDCADSESDSEDELDVEQEYQIMIETLRKIGKENITLEKENKELQTRVVQLEEELKGKLTLEKENVELHARIALLEGRLKEEIATAQSLKSEYTDQFRKVKMLGGTKKLDEILGKQRSGKANYGLGYTGFEKS